MTKQNEAVIKTPVTVQPNECPGTGTQCLIDGGGALLAVCDYIEDAHAIAHALNSQGKLQEALEACDRAFVSWQVGQIPGRPEDILALINQVRSAIQGAKRGMKI